MNNSLINGSKGGDTEGLTLVKLVEVLRKIDATPAKIKKNQNAMSDNNGGMIEF